MAGRKKGTHIDLTGQRFGNLVALERVYREGTHHTFWRCVCDCGNEKVVNAFLLKNGESNSCGCKRAEHNARGHRRHGHTTKTSKSPEYRAWQGMIARCYRPGAPGYHLYGGRGIRMSDEWRNSFEAFLSDMGPRPSARHSLERVNNDGNYEKANVVWALPEVQNRNKRSNHRIEFRGETKIISDWARDLGIGVMTIIGRLNAGWSIEDTLTRKVKPQSKDPTIAFMGRTMTIREWAKETNLGRETIRRRLAKGWPVERALTEPLPKDRLLAWETRRKNAA